MTISHTNFAKSLDWNLLKIFHEIVKSKGVTSASVSLSRKQSTISHSLKKLENELGVILCLRGPRGFELTDEGQFLFEQCDPIFKRVDGIQSNIDNLMEDIHGQIKIQMISNIVCSKLDIIFESFVAQYPHVELDIEIVPWEGISKAVLRGNIDIGISPISIKNQELCYDLLFKEHHRAYCCKGHRLFGKKVKKFENLSEEKFVLTGTDEPEQLTKFRMKYHLGHHVGGASSSLEEAKRLTLSGAGICFLPEGFTDTEVKQKKLWPITPLIEDLALNVFVISHPKTPMRMTLQCFQKVVTKTLGP